MARPQKKPFELRGFPPGLMALCFTEYKPLAITWVEDGDSIRGTADDGRGRFDHADFRLAGINAPDAGKSGATAAQERASTENLAEILGFDLEAAEAGELVVVHKRFRTAPGADKYGRWLIYVEADFATGLTANQLQVEQGHAVYATY